MRLAILGIGLALAGCATDAPPPPKIDVSVSGPVIPASRFECGAPPLPPDPAKAGEQAGSAAASYENRLRTWGQHCSNQMQALRNELRAAGQIAGDNGQPSK